jgi:acyl dehydratase
MMPLVELETLDALRALVGRELGVTDWLVVTQARIQKFAEATGDLQWIHIDRERAQRESPYGTTIAHGFLTLSLISEFMRQTISVRSGRKMTINYGLNRVRFPSAVLADSKIRGRVTLQSVKEIADGMEATYSIAVEGENVEKPCCVAEWVLRYYR